MKKSERSPELIFLTVGAIGAVFLAALGMVFAEARRDTTYPTDSAQGVVRSYLEAVASDQKVKAFSYVAEESSCTQQDLDEAFGAPITKTLVQFANIDGGRGTVQMRMQLGIGSVYGGKTFDRRTFSVVREKGQWKLTGKIWPMKYCG